MTGQWTEADVRGIFEDTFLAVALGAPRIVSKAKMEAVRKMMIANGEGDPAKRARKRAHRIKAGLEPWPEQIYGYRYVDNEKSTV